MKAVVLMTALLVCAPCLAAAPVTCLAFSPDGSLLASAAGGEVTLEPVTAPGKRMTLAMGGDRALALAFQPAGSLLAVATGIPGERGGVRLYDLGQRQWLGSISVNSDTVNSVAFSPEGALLAAAGSDHRVFVYRVDAENLSPAFALAGHTAAVRRVAFSPDGASLVTVSVDRSVKVWSAADGRLLRSLGQHTDAVHALSFRPPLVERAAAPPYCATGGDERSVRVWQPAIGRMVRIVRGHSGAVLALTYTPDGAALFSAGEEGVVRWIDPDSDEIHGQWTVSADWVYALAVSPDGKTLATGDWAGRVRRWSIGDRMLSELSPVE